MTTVESLRFFIPEAFLLIGGFILLLLDLVAKNKKAVGLLALFVLAGTLFLTQKPPASIHLFNGAFVLDSFSHFFRGLILVLTLVTLLISWSYHRMPRAYEGEYYALFLFMAFGLILMTASANLLMIFLSFEFVALLSYLFTGFSKYDPRAKEAAIKFFLLGGLASGVMLFGMTFLFGMTGSLELTAIAQKLPHSGNPLALISLILFLTGICFKIALAPFHMWAPDVYEAAPTPVAAFLTVAPKAAGFGLLLRVLYTGFPGWIAQWHPILFVISILTMTVGNITAISQSNIKRLLAYSSIAQAGYVLMGIVAGGELGTSAAIVYLIVYAFTNLGAFASVIAISNAINDDGLQAYSGMSRRSAFLAASLTIFLISLAGIPPLAGFIGKFYVYSAALNSGLYLLAGIAAINSAVAVFYYFKTVRIMYFTAAAHEEHVSVSRSLRFTLSALVLLNFFLGIFPYFMMEFVKGITFHP